MKEKIHKDGLIAEMDYEEELFQKQKEERAKYDASINRANHAYSAGLFSLPITTKITGYEFGTKYVDLTE